MLKQELFIRQNSVLIIKEYIHFPFINMLSLFVNICSFVNSLKAWTNLEHVVTNNLKIIIVGQMRKHYGTIALNKNN